MQKKPFTMDPLETSDMLKSATIYRNSEFNYIYVCYHCTSTFVNIEDTLNHVESHFDQKSDIDKLAFSDTISGIVLQPKNIEVNAETVNNSLENIPKTVLNAISSEKKLEDDIVERGEACHNQNDIKKEFSEFTNGNQCRLCDQTLDDAPMLILHLMKDHANVTKFTCPQCSKQCKNETIFLKHLQQHIVTNDTTYDALIDNITAKFEVEVKECPRTQQETDFLTCDICSSTFADKRILFSHMRKEHVYYSECEKCKRKIQGKFAFYAHQFGHLMYDDRVNGFEDEFLQQNLRKFIDDNISTDDINAVKMFGCKICSRSTVTQRFSVELHILQKHIYSAKGNKPKNERFSCTYCGRKFTDPSNCRSHQETHSLEKRFACSTCGKAFAVLRYLKLHEQLHSEIDPHQCSSCGKTFKTTSQLIRHNATHLSDVAKCPICNKEVKSHRLKIHVKQVHENEHRPYKCSVCSQGFKTSKTLRVHSFRHSGEKKFECRFHCKETFITTCGRRAHERSKHEKQ